MVMLNVTFVLTCRIYEDVTTPKVMVGPPAVTVIKSPVTAVK